MIVDKIENAKLYSSISPRIAKALEVLAAKEISKSPDGKNEVDGTNLYYLVQRYTTKPRNEGQMEAHKKYIDIQFVVDGCESIFVEDISICRIASAYNETDEAAMYDLPQKFSEIFMTKGTFCILFPQDGHLPCRTAVSESKVHKIVFKVAI
ncbi:MAG: hypothetical protein A2Y10_00440 [Planctomycetes bacterium GWF2_41_51]|nr:MAG: hypothetical protein A2Y10_00440 [Planctomycetes bacterium GWF2_41_51]HBG26094.1 YhcH/YjgK/YiaL family protein [Phycisphaerales bacterium]